MQQERQVQRQQVHQRQQQERPVQQREQQHQQLARQEQQRRQQVRRELRPWALRACYTQPRSRQTGKQSKDSVS